MRVKRGDTVRLPGLHTVGGRDVSVPDPAQLTHLQFRRFVGCPICNVHLQSVIGRYDDIQSAGIQEVVVFHSTDDELLGYAEKLPFAVVGDPNKDLYRRFGVEAAARSIMDPRAMVPVVMSKLRGGNRGKEMPQPKYPLRPTGGRLGLPADLLIDRDGTVLALKYGVHAADQWSVDELLDVAAAPSDSV